MENARKKLRRTVLTPLLIVLVLLALGFASALAENSMNRGENITHSEQLRLEEEMIQPPPPNPSTEEQPMLGPVQEVQRFGPMFDGMTLESILARAGKKDDC